MVKICIYLYDDMKPKLVHNESIKVRCVETGMEFGSISAAQRFFKGHHKLSKALNKPNRTYHGYHWETIDE